MINGDGFFMTATFNGENISADLRTRELLFTRMGNFGIDSYGNLVTADNRFVIGSRNSLHGLRNVGTISENALADVQVKDRNGDDRINSSDITFRNTINMNELVQTAYNVFTDEFGYMYGYDWNAIVTAEGNLTGNDHVIYDFDGTAAEWGTLTAEQKMEYINLQDTIRNLNDDAGTVAAANYRYYCDKTGAEIKDTTGARISYATPYAAMAAATDDAGLEAAKATANTECRAAEKPGVPSNRCKRIRRLLACLPAGPELAAVPVS